MSQWFRALRRAAAGAPAFARRVGVVVVFAVGVLAVAADSCEQALSFDTDAVTFVLPAGEARAVAIDVDVTGDNIADAARLLVEVRPDDATADGVDLAPTLRIGAAEDRCRLIVDRAAPARCSLSVSLGGCGGGCAHVGELVVVRADGVDVDVGVTVGATAQAATVDGTPGAPVPDTQLSLGPPTAEDDGADADADADDDEEDEGNDGE